MKLLGYLLMGVVLALRIEQPDYRLLVEQENGLEEQRKQGLDNQIDMLLQRLGKNKDDLDGLVGDYMERKNEQNQVKEEGKEKGQEMRFKSGTDQTRIFMDDQPIQQQTLDQQEIDNETQAYSFGTPQSKWKTVSDNYDEQPKDTPQQRRFKKNNKVDKQENDSSLDNEHTQESIVDMTNNDPTKQILKQQQDDLKEIKEQIKLLIQGQANKKEQTKEETVKEQKEYVMVNGTCDANKTNSTVETKELTKDNEIESVKQELQALKQKEEDKRRQEEIQAQKDKALIKQQEEEIQRLKRNEQEKQNIKMSNKTNNTQDTNQTPMVEAIEKEQILETRLFKSQVIEMMALMKKDQQAEEQKQSQMFSQQLIAIKDLVMDKIGTLKQNIHDIKEQVVQTIEGVHGQTIEGVHGQNIEGVQGKNIEGVHGQTHNNTTDIQMLITKKEQNDKQEEKIKALKEGQQKKYKNEQGTKNKTSTLIANKPQALSEDEIEQRIQQQINQDQDLLKLEQDMSRVQRVLDGMNLTLRNLNIYNPAYRSTQASWTRLDKAKQKMVEKQSRLREQLYLRYQKQYRPEADQDQKFIESIVSQYEQGLQNGGETQDETLIKGESDGDIDFMDGTIELQGSNVYFGFKNQLKRYREIVDVIAEYLAMDIKNSTYKGDKGEIGLEGQQGKCQTWDLPEDMKKGKRGDEGEQGKKGCRGKKGRKGKKGEKGRANRRDGQNGVDGLNGSKGPQGRQGEKGVPGEEGETGRQGMDGPEGCKGDKGIRGIKGVQGKDGMIGDNGDQGEPGQDGKNIMPQKELANRVIKVIADEIAILQSNVEVHEKIELQPLRKYMQVPGRYQVQGTRFKKQEREQGEGEQCQESMDSMMSYCDLEQMKCRTEQCLQSVSSFKSCLTGHEDLDHRGRTIWDKMKAKAQTSIVVKYVVQLQKDCENNLLNDDEDI